MAKDTKVNITDVENLLHKKILSHNLTGSNTPYAIFITGISGSGKSTTIKDIRGNFLKIQADNYRKLHPRINEYIEKFGRDEAYKKTGNYSFEFAKKLRDKAIENKLNVIFEATFSKYDTAKELINSFKDNGYQVAIVRFPTDVELSVERNIQRYEEKKDQEYTIPRITSSEDIRKMASNYENNLNKLSKEGFYIISNDRLDKLLENVNKINLSEKFKQSITSKQKQGEKQSLLLPTKNSVLKMKI